MTMVEHLHMQLLDRKRPLWQYHVIEGLEGGRFALYLKTHHACLDGGGGVLALDIVSDREPKPRDPYPKPEIRLGAPRKPGFFELLGLSFGSIIQQQFDAVASVPAGVRALRNVVRSAIKDRTWDLNAIKPAPRSIFNDRVGRRRAFATGTFPVAEMKLMGKAAGATLNDIVLSICAGALRRYLDERNQAPTESLVAAVPVSMREVGDTNQSNQVASIFPRIGSHITDPLERLAYVAQSTKRAKSQMADVREIVPRDFSIVGAPALAPLIWQIVEWTGVNTMVPSIMNVAISNVPGSRRPMYFAGIEVKEFYPVSIATHGVALNITVQSYVDRMDFGITTCRDICPDVQKLADLMMEEFNALKAALMKQVAKAEREKPQPDAPKKKAKATAAAKPRKAAKPRATKAPVEVPAEAEAVAPALNGSANGVAS